MKRKPRTRKAASPISMVVPGGDELKKKLLTNKWIYLMHCATATDPYNAPIYTTCTCIYETGKKKHLLVQNRKKGPSLAAVQSRPLLGRIWIFPTTCNPWVRHGPVAWWRLLLILRSLQITVRITSSTSKWFPHRFTNRKQHILFCFVFCFF